VSVSIKLGRANAAKRPERNDARSRVKVGSLARSPLHDARGVGPGGFGRLAQALAGAQSRTDAVSSFVHFWFEEFHTPIAAWLAEADGEDRALVAVRGVDRKTLGLIQRDFAVLSNGGSADLDPNVVAERFGSMVGEPATPLVATDQVVLVIAQPLEAPVEGVGVFFAAVFERLDAMRAVESGQEQLDLGLACTAHEIRAPLLAVRAALEQMVTGDPATDDRDMLRRSLRELEGVVQNVDSILRWAVGSEPLNERRVELVEIVRQASESCSADPADERIRVAATGSTVVLADPHYIRAAVSNLLRNALAYSPMDSPVTVTIAGTRDAVRITIEDEGPGVPEGERDRIFQPFERGETGRRVRQGSGLGLFIAHRVVEAHGGTISVERRHARTAFHVELPVRPNSSERARA